MPLIKPEVQKVLRAAGLLKESAPVGEETTVVDKLNGAGLSIDEVLEELANLALRSGNEGIRHRALQDTLKLHGALKESAPAAPSFTIVIQPSGFPTSPVVQDVNPILLPRQLLSTLEKKEN